MSDRGCRNRFSMNSMNTDLAAPREIAAFYHHTLRSVSLRRDWRGTGSWMQRDPAPEDLVHAIETLEASPRRVLKSSGINHVLKGEMLGESVILKRYDLPRPRHRIKYLMRPSRGRRAWAAALTLRACRIPTPPCLGFFECGGRLPGTSYAIFRAEDDILSARTWIKAWLHQRTDAFRTGFRDDLVDALLALYRRGIYHGDTKTSNMLVRAPDDPDRREFLWIDLECVRFGVSPSRRQILRNLVQLNGSVGSKLSEGDRLEFLDEMAEIYPWLAGSHIAERIRAWTLKRLAREQSGQCGP